MLSFQRKKNIAIKKNSIACVLLSYIIAQTCQATPLNNVFDTQPIYTVYGLDKYYTEKCRGEIRFHLSPFYQQTSTARNGQNRKVPAGDRLGEWNFLGIFFDAKEAASKNFNSSNYPKTFASQTVVSNITSQAPATIPTPGLSENRYRVGPVTPPGIKPEVLAGGLTNKQNFAQEEPIWAYVSVPLNYEKIGLRSQLAFDFGFGLGVTAKGGVVDVRQRRQAFRYEPLFDADRQSIARTPAEPAATEDDKVDAANLYRALFDPDVFDAIGQELDYSVRSQHHASAEDLHLQAHWHIPFDLYDNRERVTMSMIPYFAVGVWLPTGRTTSYNKAFSVPTGNDGYYGFTADFSIALDFPVIPKDGQTLQWNVGGGVLGFTEERKISNYHVPTSNQNDRRMQLQAGIFPWTTTIEKTPGITWYMNASMKAENFLDGLSAYFDFIYTQHLRDRITIQEPNAVKAALFNMGLSTLKRNSEWKNQQVNAALNYKLAEMLSFGAGVQAHISGTRVYRSVTLLSSLTFTF